MKGRKPTPDAIKKMRGTDQPCRMNDNNIDTLQNSDLITNASQLKVLRNKRSKEIFKEKANQLMKLQMLTELDLEQLAIYANNLDMLFKCIKEIKKGEFREIHDENGYLLRYIENPYLKLYKDLVVSTNKMAADFGFNPVSRNKFTIEKPQATNPLDQFM